MTQRELPAHPVGQVQGRGMSSIDAYWVYCSQCFKINAIK